MSKVEKQKQKLKERIEQLENELKSSLHKKSSGPAISVPAFTSKIQALKVDLAKLG
jgi:DNA-binding protein YbaB